MYPRRQSGYPSGSRRLAAAPGVTRSVGLRAAVWFGSGARVYARETLPPASWATVASTYGGRATQASLSV
jgi:hypothetical protein